MDLNNSSMMQNRISQLENEEVDYLRLDRIKIQRKRMQHILEVIKDLSFKNKQLFKENAALKQQQIQQMHHDQYQKRYHQVTSQKAILIQKNMNLNQELDKCKQTIVHQEILIESLKKELYGQGYSKYQNGIDRRHDYSYDQAKQRVLIEENEILKAQYDDLQKEYSKLYKQSYKQISASQIQEHSRYTKQDGFIYTPKGKENSKLSKTMFREYGSRKRSQQKIDGDSILQITHNDVAAFGKMKEKYDKYKRMKKEMVAEIKVLRDAVKQYQSREDRHIQLIEMLKEQKTKICWCHINKLKKKMEGTSQQKIRQVQATH